MQTKPVPQEWIQKQINDLITASEKMKGASPAMANAAYVRAQYYMDLLQAWQQSGENR